MMSLNKKENEARPLTIRQEYETIFANWLYGEFEEVWDIKEGVTSLTSNTRRKIPSPKVMAEMAVEYLVMKRERSEPITYLGMIIHCNLASRSAFDKYMNYSSDFKSLIKRIKMVLEENLVRGLYNDHYRASSFLLKTTYSQTYSETTHQIIENKDFVIDVTNPHDK